MGTEVLRAQDILADRFRVSAPSPFHRRKNNGNGYGYGYQKRKFNTQHQQQHVAQLNSRRLSNADESKATRNSRSDSHSRPEPVVTILRRGESLDSLNSKIKREKNARMEMEQKKKAVYAGSAFSVSPAPSSLPLPTFFRKQPELKSFDDSATRDLRRLLRLE